MNERLLREHLWSLGVRPVQFAAKADISMPTVYKLYHGKPVSEETLYKVRRALAELERTSKGPLSKKAV